MSNESGTQLAELRDLAHRNMEQLSRAATGWVNIARKMLDATEANVAALCDHAAKLAQAESPVECVRLHTEFVRSAIAATHRQSTDLMGMDGDAAVR